MIFKKYIFLLIGSIILLISMSSCQDVKEGLTGAKQNNSDEFLVRKKNPLVLPPDFDKLPVPEAEKKFTNAEEDIEIDIEKILGSLSEDEDSLNTSLEKSILDEINDNKDN